MRPVAIIGGGITGLTAAFRLAEKGLPVTVYEASPRVGGVIKTVERDGFLAECGPNTILETSPVIVDLVRDLGLESERLYSDPAASNRYILRGGKAVPVPGTPLEFFATSLFSLKAKLRLPTETLVRRSPADADESVAEFVKRRLGQEFLDYAINPMIGGIYAGDPARLSVRHAFPKLRQVEQRYGSLLLGQFLGARERRKSKEISKQSAPKFSFARGLETLTAALGRKIGASVRVRASVQSMRRIGAGWELRVATPNGFEFAEHSSVLLAAPSHKLAEIAVDTGAGGESASLKMLGEIPYAPVASLVLGFRRGDVRHALDGFGLLVPAVERRNILGVIFSSSLFPGRAPKDHVTLSCYLGGMRSPELAALGADRAVETALADLKDLVGASGRPVFVQHVPYPKAIPQYEVGFGRFKTFMTELEGRVPGLFLAGHFRDGISLGDSIVAGRNAAEKIETFVRSESRQNPLFCSIRSPDFSVPQTPEPIRA